MPDYYRRVIRIRAEDSPNVQLGLQQQSRGKEVTYEELIPGVLSYAEYVRRRATWDKIRQCIGLDGVFYEGAELLLYPPEWLNLAEQRAGQIKGQRRTARTMGVDSAMGGDNTSWAVVDRLGLIHLVSMKTPDTTEITGKTIALIREYNLNPNNVLFDYGGGGKAHADRLRKQGFNVRTVGFGESARPEKRRVIGTLEQRKLEEETRFAYKNRRAEMYHRLRLLLDPSEGEPFALPAKLINKSREDGGPSLRSQLAPIPLWHDEEGRIYLPSKQRRPDQKDTGRKTLKEIIGCSPDEADALVLATYGLERRTVRMTAGAVK